MSSAHLPIIRHNYDTRRLWQALPWHDESLARMLPLENRRIYSISSAPSEALVLTVGKLSLTSRKLGQDLESGHSQRQAIVTRILEECGELLALERPELADRLEDLLGWSATWLARLKLELAEGITAFEAHEEHVVERAGQRLTTILAGIPALLMEYVHGLERAGSRIGIR